MHAPDCWEEEFVTCGDSLLPLSSLLEGDLDPLVVDSNAIDLSPSASSTKEFALQAAAARCQGFKLFMDDV